MSKLLSDLDKNKDNDMIITSHKRKGISINIQPVTTVKISRTMSIFLQENILDEITRRICVNGMSENFRWKYGR